MLYPVVMRRTMKFTQEIKDKWLARLRDPNSKQMRNSGHNASEIDTTDSNVAMCCLVHLQYAIYGYASVRFDRRGYRDLSQRLLGYNLEDRLIAMNDREGRSLSQIADYIEHNVSAAKE
jgi:hypothetical protein